MAWGVRVLLHSSFLAGWTPMVLGGFEKGREGKGRGQMLGEEHIGRGHTHTVA